MNQFIKISEWINIFDGYDDELSLVYCFFFDYHGGLFLWQARVKFVRESTRSASIINK